MAVYTQVDAEELAEYLAAYDIGEATAFKGVAEGVENSNYLLETTKGRYILTLFEKRVRPADLPFFIGVKQHLAGKGFPCPLPVAAKDGAALRTLKDRPSVIITFLEGLSPRRPTPAMCRSLGEGLARLHMALQDFDGARPNDLSLSAWPGLFAGRAGEADALSPGLADQISTDLQRLSQDWPTDLPTGVIHADLFPDNAFFRGETLSGVIDFYFACTDAFAYDLAVCLNAWCFEPRGEFNATNGRALCQGYQSVRPLTEPERRALPALAAGAAMRFFLTRLADWAATPPGALVRPKNPMEYADRLGFHRRVRRAEDYGA